MTLSTRINENRSRPMKNLLTYGQNWQVAWEATKCRDCAQVLANLMGNERPVREWQAVLDQHDNGQHAK